MSKKASLIQRIWGRLGREYRGRRMKRYLRKQGAQVGHNPLYLPSLPIVVNEGRLVIGHSLVTQSFQTKPEFAVSKAATLEIGNEVFVNKGVTIGARKQIEIGDNCRLGDYSCLLDSNYHEVAPDEGVITEPIKLGNNVWLGRFVVVLPGVTIGDHSVVAAGAIVTNDVPPRTVVAGIPARVVREFECPDDYIRD